MKEDLLAARIDGVLKSASGKPRSDGTAFGVPYLGTWFPELSDFVLTGNDRPMVGFRDASPQCCLAST
jgi:hypothetical protein